MWNKIKTQTLLLDKFFIYCVAVNTLAYFIFILVVRDLSIIGYITRFFHYFLVNFIFFFIVFYLLSKIPDKIGHVVKIVICMISIIFFIIEIFLIFNLSSLLGQDFIEISLQSNMRESIEFLEFYFQPNIFIIYGIFIIASILFFRFFKSSFLVKKNFLVSFFLFLFVVAIAIESSKENDVCLALDTSTMPRITCNVTKALKDTKEYLEQYAKLQIDLDTFVKKQTGDGEYILENNSTISNIVIIIGESTQKNHMGIYNKLNPKNKALETNPLLSQISPKNLILFNDVISPATHTDTVLKKVLTFSNYENKEQIPWYETMNLIDTMKMAGYHTTWLSNQEAISIYGNAPETIARRSDNVLFTAISSSKYDQKPYDGSLLPLLDKIIADKKAEKNLYILHLMGTHTGFKYRYPNKYDVFGISDINNTSLSMKQKYVQSTYANAILYNDFVVNEIIKRFKDSDSIIFYFSDHGEEVYDFRDFAGHAGSSTSRFMVEIPFIVYVSDGFIERHRSSYKRLAASQNRSFMTDDFIHALLDISDIKTIDFVENRSLFSDRFNHSRVRKVYDFDYDKELKSQKSYHSNDSDET